MDSIKFAVVSLVPALLLCSYVFNTDSKEKEPISLLAILFGLGAVVYIPVIFAEEFMLTFVNNILGSHVTYDFGGMASYTSEGFKLLHNFLNALLGSALMEEAMKFLVLFLVTHRNKNFNCLFDGIVYSIFVTLGFAVAENIYNAYIGGWDTLILRTLSTLPGHILFGIVMGYCYTLWHTYFIAGRIEKRLDGITVSKPFRSWYFIVLTILLPIIVHALYSFVSFYHFSKITWLFIVVIVTVYVICFLSIRKFASDDKENSKAISTILIKKYPVLEAQKEAVSALVDGGDLYGKR